jgi:hypothetical protein
MANQVLLTNQACWALWLRQSLHLYEAVKRFLEILLHCILTSSNSVYSQGSLHILKHVQQIRFPSLNKF